jgi:hypothetical protein
MSWEKDSVGMPIGTFSQALFIVGRREFEGNVFCSVAMNSAKNEATRLVAFFGVGETEWRGKRIE